MQKVFEEVNSLDKKCYEKYFLSEDILMEHAALAMFNHIKSKFKNNSSVLIICGNGNNGADGLVLARLLYKQFDVKLFVPNNMKSEIAKLQEKRTLVLGIKTITALTSIKKLDVLVDCLFGSGLNRDLSTSSTNLIKQMNNINAYKLSCDIPSGINLIGQISTIAFKANTTITMGAYKKCLFTDKVKDYVGELKKANLGIPNDLYENKSSTYLLEEQNLKLPFRNKKDTNKGSFGHLCVLLGNKKGAGIITCKTALSFGVGLVTAISNDEDIPYSIMYAQELPKKTSAIALGMGLGLDFNHEILNTKLPLLLDADILANPVILNILHKDNIIITPHPKEFCVLLNLCSIANISIQELQNNRFKYLNDFCKKYPSVVVLLKGANVLIQQDKLLYINNLGSSNLSFGGSGDILAGLIASLLAQGHRPIDSAIQGSLCHTIASMNFKGNDYSLNVDDLINQIKIL